MVLSFACAFSDLRLTCATMFIGSSKQLSEFHPSGLLNSELTNCPRTAAGQGELAAQWQQTMGTLQRVDQETVPSQNMANALENLGRTRSDATRAARVAKVKMLEMRRSKKLGNATIAAKQDT